MLRKIKKGLNRLSENIRALNIVKGRLVKPMTINANIVEKLIYNYSKPILYVGKNGEEFSTIQEAVKNAMDTPKNPVTISVAPGTYIESIKLCGGRYISIIGTNKTTCILQDNTGNYYTPPLEIAGNSSIKNMTVIATHDDGIICDMPSYAIHHDFAGKGNSLISNCKLISYQHFAVGVGLRNNQTLTIEKCELYSTAKYGLYVHNRMKNDAENQKLIVKDSVIKALKGTPILIQDSNHNTGGGLNDKKDTEFGFYNNTFKSDNLDESKFLEESDLPLKKGCLAGYIKLTSDSYGNNISQFNATK